MRLAIKAKRAQQFAPVEVCVVLRVEASEGRSDVSGGFHRRLWSQSLIMWRVLLTRGAAAMAARPALVAQHRAIGIISHTPPLRSPQRHVCATTTTNARIGMLRDYLVSRSRLFKKLDADGNGAIDTKELQAALQGAGAASISAIVFRASLI